jgi:hypothetical protein
MGKYSFANRSIRIWNQLQVEELATFSCRLHIFRKGFRKAMKSSDLKREDEMSKSGRK